VTGAYNLRYGPNTERVRAVLRQARELTPDEVAALDSAEASVHPQIERAWEFLRAGFDAEPWRDWCLAAGDDAWDALAVAAGRAGISVPSARTAPEDAYWRVMNRPGFGAARAARLVASLLTAPPGTDPSLVSALRHPWDEVVWDAEDARKVKDGSGAGTPPFSWEALSSSTNRRYWTLGWPLVARQQQIIAAALQGWDATSGQRNQQLSPFITLLDLEVGPETGHRLAFLGDERAASWPGCRDLTRPADETSAARLPAGTSLEWQGDFPDDTFYEGLGVTVWRDEVGAWYASALEGRWGCEAVFTAALIAPARSARGVDRSALAAQLRAATIEYRFARGLPPEGCDAALDTLEYRITHGLPPEGCDPALEAFVVSLRELPDSTRSALAAANATRLARIDQDLERLPSEVQAAATAAWWAVSSPRVGRRGPDLVLGAAGRAAQGAIAAAFGEGVISPVRRRQLAAPWLSVGLALPVPKGGRSKMRRGQDGSS
jgi:hypothetical protein